LLDGGADLVSRDARVRDQRIDAAITAEVGAAEADATNAEQRLAGGEGRCGALDDVDDARAGDFDGFHGGEI
jgi:hypothetical protein